MADCPNCGFDAGESKFCTNCGTKIEKDNPKSFCHNCGAEVSGSKFCPNCGSEINGKKPDRTCPNCGKSKIVMQYSVLIADGQNPIMVLTMLVN